MIIAAALAAKLVTRFSLGHWAFHYFGIAGSGPWYAFWSGIGSDIGEVTLAGAVMAHVRSMNCNHKGCWRIKTHPVVDTPFKSCKKHHPELKHHKHITAEIMELAYHRAKAAKAGTPPPPPVNDTAAAA